jgi:hypothetical protein
MRMLAFAKIYSVIIASITISYSQNEPAEFKVTNSPTSIQKVYTKFTYKIISAPHNTFGYDIYSEGSLIIHQNSIPGLPGDKGFTTKAKAEKVAKLVIDKLSAGEMPPTVSIEELKKLKIIQ